MFKRYTFLYQINMNVIFICISVNLLSNYNSSNNIFTEISFKLVIHNVFEVYVDFNVFVEQ